MAKRRGLGKGLDALLGAGEVTPITAAEREQLVALPVERLQRGRYQPRTDMRDETLQELAESIRAQGVVQPIVVRPVSEAGRYEIVAGERRWRAAQLAGLDTIPAVVRELGDQTAMSLALIENLQREDLTPIEEATALHRLVNEFQLTHQAVAEAVGRSRAAVSNMLRLLELHGDVRDMLSRGELEMGHARALLGAEQRAQPRLAREVVAAGLSVRATEQLIRKHADAGTAKRKAPRPAKTDPDIARLADRLAETLGAPVRIEHGEKGAGRLVIRYHNLDELEGILSHIR